MQIRSENIKGELQAVLYTDSGTFIKVLEEDAYGIKVPHSLMEKLRENALAKLEDIVSPDEEEEVDDQKDLTPKRGYYLQPVDPKARVKETLPTEKPKQFLGKPRKEKLSDPRKVRVPPKTHKQKSKGFWGTLLGIGAMTHFLTSRERERQEERMERELDRIRRITER